jgi:hypothetical protein
MEDKMRYFADVWPDGYYRLFRVHCDDDADFEEFYDAPAQRWTVRDGWVDYPNFQLDFTYSDGDAAWWQRIGADEVETAMQSMRERAASYG